MSKKKKKKKKSSQTCYKSTSNLARSLLICADAQADLSLRWAHNYFVGFVVLRLKANDFTPP